MAVLFPQWCGGYPRTEQQQLKVTHRQSPQDPPQDNRNQFTEINLFAINEPRYVRLGSRLRCRTVGHQILPDVELPLAERDFRGPSLWYYEERVVKGRRNGKWFLLKRQLSFCNTSSSPLLTDDMNEVYIGLLGEDWSVRGHLTRVLASSVEVHVPQGHLVFVRMLPLQLKFSTIIISPGRGTAAKLSIQSLPGAVIAAAEKVGR